MFQDKLLGRKGRTLILAYDHGLEHGPTDFNIRSVDPDFVFDLAVKAKVNGIVVLPGVAEEYGKKYGFYVPLIVKLNGKSYLPEGEPYSSQFCSVKRAISLGASAVGYTIYLGSQYEARMLKEFGRIVEEAHSRHIPAVAWVYPRGQAVKDELSTETLAYAARTGLEMGADIVKLKYNDDTEGFKWVVRNAGMVDVVVAGGEKHQDYLSFLRMVKNTLEAGAKGIAVGRNVWQSENPLGILEALSKLIFHDVPPEKAISYLTHA
jgi:class I fructose-bisphosphate aldolase